MITQKAGSNLNKVAFADGTVSDWLKHLRSSGMDKSAFLAHTMAASAAKLRAACDQLPDGMRQALEQVRSRLTRDELPLLSLLQVEPLQLQS